MRNWIKPIVTVLVIGGLAAGGWAAFAPKGKSKKDEITYEKAPAVKGKVQSFVTAQGVIKPWKEVEVKSNVGGPVKELLVDLGDTVKQGQLIALIDQRDTQTDLDQSNADRAAAIARQKQAETNWEQEKLQAKARVLSAQRSLENAKARLAEASANAAAQPEITKANISQATASKISAEKLLAQANESRVQLQQQLGQLKDVTNPLDKETVATNVMQAKANEFVLDREYKRQRSLLAQGYVGQSDVDAAYNRLAQAKATVRQSEQRQRTLTQEQQLAVRELEARIRETDSRIEEAQARIDQAEASLKAAKENAVLNEVRVHQKEAAAAAVEQAKADLKTAEAQQNQIAVRLEEIKAAESQIVRSKAAVFRAETNLGFTKILAPRDGIVVEKLVEEGTVVPSSRQAFGSTSALLKIGDITKLWIVCNVDETDIGQVSQGQKVEVQVDAYPSTIVDGKVIRIDPQAIVEQNVTLIPVTVELTIPDPRFKPGMNADCKFISEEAEDVLTVPNEALKEADGEYKVQILVSGKPQDVPVQVGIAGQDATEIKSGLKEGDEVITRTIVPEKPEVNNPFGSPFGQRPRPAGGGAPGGGGRPGGGGGR